MLIIVLGMPASGSTWVYNVARDLLGTHSPSAICLQSEGGLTVLDNVALEQGDVLLKAHSMDLRLLRIAKWAGAKVIVTRRHPLDSAVSQMQRFGHSLRQIAADLSKSMCSIGALPDCFSSMILSYEDRFFERAQTILDIGDFLGFPVSETAARDLHRSLQPDAVKRQIGAIFTTTPDGSSHDPLTQWHATHLGDGRSGKWKEQLRANQRDTLNDCLGALSTPKQWRRHNICWSHELFCYDDEAIKNHSGTITCRGEEKILVYGPYLYLPAGRWRVRLGLRTGFRASAKLRVDVHLRESGRGTVAERQVHLPWIDGRPTLEFDHDDHFEPVEVRVHSIPGERCNLRLSDAEFAWLGPPRARPSYAMPING